MAPRSRRSSAGDERAGELGELLRELAEADAHDLIQEARAAACARARTIIEDALVDELLQAAAQASSHSSPEPRTTASHPRLTGDAWWAYCVLRAERARDVVSGLLGIEPGTRVEAVVEGELAALVSPVPLAEYGDERLREHLEDIGWLERTARAHEAVLEKVLHQDVVVPLRLCTIYRDSKGVRRALRENAEVFMDNLAAIEGCQEWGVKVFFDSTKANRDGRTVSDTSGETRSGTEYLAGRRREREQAERGNELCVECTGDVHRVLAALARQDRTNPVQRQEAHGRDAEMVLNGAYLVEQDRVQEFEHAVALLQERWAADGLLVELTGPWPSYNFVSDSAGMVA